MTGYRSRLPRRPPPAALPAPAPALLLPTLVSLLLFASPWGGASRAHANGVPTLVPLAYIEGLSNWGPEQASGELELSFAEGYARLEASGLPELAGRRYQGWLVNSESNDAISVGRFNADSVLEVDFDGVLPPIADFGFDLFIITVEPEPDDAPQPTSSRTIGGYFSLIGVTPADGTSATDTGQQPAELPATGDPTLLADIGRSSLLVAAMALSLLIGLRLGGGGRDRGSDA